MFMTSVDQVADDGTSAIGYSGAMLTIALGAVPSAIFPIARWVKGERSLVYIGPTAASTALSVAALLVLPRIGVCTARTRLLVTASMAIGSVIVPVATGRLGPKVRVKKGGPLKEIALGALARGACSGAVAIHLARLARQSGKGR